MRLQKALPLPGFASGAARDLMQKLERPLGRARIAIRKTEIGIDDADQIELREMMALGDELRADDDIELALGDTVEFLAQPLDRFDQIAGEHDAARIGKQSRDFFLQALDTRAHGRERILRLAFRTGRRLRHRETAMVADQTPLEPVIDQPGIAILTRQPETAGAA